MTPMSKRKGYGWMEKKKKPVDPGPGMETMEVKSITPHACVVPRGENCYYHARRRPSLPACGC